MIAIPDGENIQGMPANLQEEMFVLFILLAAEVNVETIHEAAPPLASLLDFKSLGDPIMV